MNVILTLSTPETPEPHEVIHRGVDSVRYAKAWGATTYPGVELTMTNSVHRYSDKIIIDMVVVP